MASRRPERLVGLLLALFAGTARPLRTPTATLCSRDMDLRAKTQASCVGSQYQQDFDELVRAQPSRRVKAIADAASAIADGFANSSSKAAQALHRILDVDGRHILAFKETWTDKDTEILRALDDGSRAWTEEDVLTTDGVKARLPTLQDFEEIVEEKMSIAIVGAGGSLMHKNLGRAIDEHNEVVRFNDYVINPPDTGSRTDFQVLNKNVQGQPNVPLFDLEMWSVPDSLCWRLNHQGKFAMGDSGSKVFLVRPSARCGMDESVQEFTRGFLFYWLVGTLSEHVDLYGFAASSGRSHYGQPNKEPILEPSLEFEHKFYEQLAERLKQNELPLAVALAQTGEVGSK